MRVKRGALVAVVLVIPLKRAAADLLDVRARRVEGDVRPQPRGDLERVRPSLTILAGDSKRHPHAGSRLRELESRRHYADHFEWFAVEP